MGLRGELGGRRSGGQCLRIAIKEGIGRVPQAVRIHCIGMRHTDRRTELLGEP